MACLLAFGIGTRMKKMLEKMEMREDAMECFTKMGEYRKMQDWLRGQMMQLDSPELKMGVKEFWDRYCETTFYEIAEHDGFKSTFTWIILSFSGTPLNHSLTLEQAYILQFLHGCFGHFALSPAHGEISNLLDIKLGLALLGSHLSITSSNLGSGATRGANGRWTEKVKAWGSSDLKMAAARNQMGKNPRSYCTVK